MKIEWVNMLQKPLEQCCVLAIFIIVITFKTYLLFMVSFRCYIILSFEEVPMLLCPSYVDSIGKA